MEVKEAQALLAGVVAADSAGAGREQLRAAMADLARLRAFLDGRAVALARRFEAASVVPERELASAGRMSARQAERLLERAKVTRAVPALDAALAAGVLAAGHVDAFGRGWRSLEPDLRPKLAAAAQQLVAVGRRSTADEFDRAVRAEVRRVRVDDGQARVERQRRATRLRTWIDRDGMWCLFGRYDPETGVRLHRRLLDASATCFAEAVPDLAPDDAGERADFLRAHALAALTEGNGRRPGRPEIVVVVDTTAPDADGTPAVDWSLPVELPTSLLRRLWPGAWIHPVALAGGVVVHAPGELNLGRTTRLANRAQRRVLRALYPTCALPGCDVRFDSCDIHHVIRWEPPALGTTDLDNLLPVCSRHHQAIHDRGWDLKLTPDRELTVRYPDGVVAVTRPPMRR
jgi:hypothetical protein